jgi:hypothetical protein
MKRILPCIPLLGLAPLGYFLGSYLSGLGTISWWTGYVIASLGMFVVPLLVSSVFVICCKTGWIGRTILFIVVLFIQESIFLCPVVPGRATAELMGIAHRLQREFPPDQLRDCADRLRTQFHAGTLKRGKEGDGGNYFPADDSAVEVADTELPASLRGRFQRVFILTDPAISNELVIFAFDHETGIVSGNLVPMPNWAYPIADGVDVYQDHP